MKIAVKYSAQARRAAGVAAEELELAAGARVQDAVAAAAARHGEPLRGLLLSADGRVQPSILLFVGDEQVGAEGPRALREGDVLTIMPPIAGG